MGLGILLGSTLLYYVAFLTYAVFRPVEYHEGPAPEVTYTVELIDVEIKKENGTATPEEIRNIKDLFSSKNETD